MHDFWHHISPFLIPIITVIGAALAYRWQKKIDIRNDLVKQKRDIYRKLLSELCRQISNKGGTIPHELNALKGEAFIISSDKVTVSIGVFFSAIYKVSNEEKLQGAANTDSVTNMLESFARMVLAMRKDCFEASELTLKEVQNVMPFGYSEQMERIVTK